MIAFQPLLLPCCYYTLAAVFKHVALLVDLRCKTHFKQVLIRDLSAWCVAFRV